MIRENSLKKDLLTCKKAISSLVSRHFVSRPLLPVQTRVGANSDTHKINCQRRKLRGPDMVKDRDTIVIDDTAVRCCENSFLGFHATVI
jgi:hypothetical protein